MKKIVLMTTFLLTTFVLELAIGKAQSVTPANPKVEVLNLQIATAKNSEMLLKNSQDHYLKRIAELEDRKIWAQKMISEREDRLTSANLSPESYPDVVKLLQTLRVELLIDITGLNARYELMTKQAEEQLKQIDASNALELQIARESQALAEQQLETKRKLNASGHLSSMELQASELEVKKYAMAIAEIESERFANTWSQELAALSLDRAEKNARLTLVKEMLDVAFRAKPDLAEVNKSRDQIRVLQSLTDELSSKLIPIQIELQKAQHELQSLEEELNAIQKDK